MIKAANLDLIHSKRKAINALFPYVVHLGRSGEQAMIDMFLRVVTASHSEGFIWHRAKPLLMRLSNTQNPLLLDWVIRVVSPHVPWHTEPYEGNVITRWAKAASAVSHAEGLDQYVVDALLHIASVDSLRPHIPDGIWTWLKNQPFLPPECPGRSRGSGGDVVRRIRELADIEILRSYLVLVWSEWDCIDSQESGGLAEMQVSIREDFCGTEMWCYRQDLIKRLDYVLEQLDGGLDGLEQHKPGLDIDHVLLAGMQYSELRRVVVEVDADAMNGLARKLSRLIFSGLLGFTDTHRIPLDFHMRSAPPMPVIFWSTCYCFDQLPGLYTSLYPVAAFPCTRPAARTFQVCLDVSCPCLLDGPNGSPLRCYNYPWAADGRSSTGPYYVLVS